MADAGTTRKWLFRAPAGVNDTADQALRLAGIANRLRAHVNLIALNPTPLGEGRAPTRSGIEDFARLVAGHEANVTIRDTREADIDEACGQLRVMSGNRRPTG